MSDKSEFIYECGKCNKQFDKKSWGNLEHFYKNHYEKCGEVVKVVTFVRYKI